MKRWKLTSWRVWVPGLLSAISTAVLVFWGLDILYALPTWLAFFVIGILGVYSVVVNDDMAEDHKEHNEYMEKRRRLRQRDATDSDQ